MSIPKFLLSSLLLAALAAPAWAEDEDPARGRLPDGRAFRTDAQGTQLVDYIAELELSVEQLTRRVHGLEFEVEEKQKLVDRLSAGGAKDSKLAERDLLGGREVRQGTRGNEKDLMERTAETRDCSAEIASSQQLLEKARFDLELARRVQDKNRGEYEDTVEKLRNQYSNMKCPRADCSAEVSRASAAGVRLEQELEQTHIAFNSERDAQQRRIQDYETSLTRLRTELTAKDDQLKQVQVKLAAAEREAEAAAARPVPVANVPRAEESNDSAMQTVARQTHPELFGRQSDQRASFAAAKTRAVAGLRGNLTSELNQLRDLISIRDNAFRSYVQTGKSYTFKPSQLVSRRGYTLSWVAERVRSADNVYELSALSRDIKDIRARVQDDIALIKRMKKTA